eukprot:COSAG06_NODE_37017_length_440_cov_0.950147_1_plen_56_part_10
MVIIVWQKNTSQTRGERTKLDIAVPYDTLDDDGEDDDGEDDDDDDGASAAGFSAFS